MPPANYAARPTTDFAKEGLFNMLINEFDLEEISVLDLFSGTGSISLELLSRGCASVTSVELDPLHFTHLRKSAIALKDDNWHLVRDDVFRYIRRCTSSYDIIFADPPYALKELKDIPELVLQSNMLKEGGLFIFEHGKDNDFSNNPHFFRHVAYGSVNFTFFKKEKQSTTE